MIGGIKKISLREISLEIKNVNTALYNVINKLHLDDSFYFYKVSYPFGTTIVEKGLFHIPLSDGEIVPVTDPRVDAQFQEDIRYSENGLPAGILLKNACEVFISHHDHIIPVVIPTPGTLLALWKQLDHKPVFHPIKLFNITAGARSIFMLANISDYMLHSNLKRDFNVHYRPPATLLEQWSIFKAITEYAKSSWSVEILLFPGNWIEKAKNDPTWHELYRLFLENAWLSSGYERNQIFYEFAFSCAQASKHLKPNPFLLDTIRHNISITLGSAPGFRPATDEQLGPIKLIQEAYVESYALKKYTPTIMHPAHFDLLNKNSRPTYYSLQLPTTLSFLPRSRQQFSTLFDMREVKQIMQIFMDELKQNKVRLDGTILSEIPKLVRYEFFHNKVDQHHDIKLTSSMVKDDPALAYSLYSPSPSGFSENGNFLRGCIRTEIRS